jgi:hypothetical protein
MQLPPPQVERFYSIWKPLIRFVNERLGLVPGLATGEEGDPWNVQEVARVRDALWANDALREAFVAENPAGLPAEDLAIVASWRHRRAGEFYVLRQLKKYTVFLDTKGPTVYGVLGLASPLDEVVPFMPCYVKAVLLPFEGVIVYDSLINSYNITFGKGIRTSLEESYRDAKERGAIVTSLLPAGPASREQEQEAARSTDARVLEVFRTHLFRSGLSPKVVERDVATAAAFADEHLVSLPEPRSLRDFGPAQVEGYLARLRTDPAVKEARRRQVLTGMKRFLGFLRDTDRMDYDSAGAALDAIKDER